jgi:DNA-binding response OmpR family regulator
MFHSVQTAVAWYRYLAYKNPGLRHVMTNTTSLSRPAAARLLVVDDDASIQNLMQAIFRPEGMMVDFAPNGRAALNKLRSERYDALILDLMLPELNGFELIRELKSREPSVLARTIVLTAAADRTLRDFDDAKLVRRVMRKPFELRDFVDEVRACCGSPAMGAETGT